MGLFDDILNDTPKVEVLDLPKKLIKPLDPRPDLESDSQMWTQLLAIARDMDQSLEFFGIMLGFRSVGTRLIMLTEPQYRGEYRMRGQFDGTGANHWATPEEYSAAAIKYLGPANNPNKYGTMLKEALGKLSFKKAA